EAVVLDLREQEHLRAAVRLRAVDAPRDDAGLTAGVDGELHGDPAAAQRMNRPRIAALPLRQDVEIGRRIVPAPELGVQRPRVAAGEAAIDPNPVRAGGKPGDCDADAETGAGRRRALRVVEDLPAEDALAVLVAVEGRRPRIAPRCDPPV